MLTSYIFAPIKKQSFSLDEIAHEVLCYRKSFVNLSVGKSVLENIERYLSEKSEYDRIVYFDPEKKMDIIPKNPMYCWKGLNFTAAEGVLNPEFVSFGMSEYLFKKNWQINEKFKLPKLLALLNNLGLKKIVMIRALEMAPGCFGPFHRDASRFWQYGYLQLNITLKSGGSSLLVETPIGDYAIDSDIFLFNDNYLHGVPTVSSDRLVLVVVGEFDLDILSPQIDQSKSIPVDCRTINRDKTAVEI